MQRFASFLQVVWLFASLAIAHRAVAQATTAASAPSEIGEISSTSSAAAASDETARAPAEAVAPLSPPAVARAAARISLGPAEQWVDTQRVNRLESALVEHAHADSMIRQWGGLGALLVGGALIASGVVVAVDDDWSSGSRIAVSGAAWVAGASLIATAIYRWCSTTPAEERLARWTELRANRKLEIFDFARFEGELASEAQSARLGRSLTAFGSLGLVAGGGGLIALAASSALEESNQTDAYVLGGVLAGVGVIQALALVLQQTPAEKAWRHYSEGGGGLSELRAPVAPRPHLAWSEAAAPPAASPALQMTRDRALRTEL